MGLDCIGSGSLPIFYFALQLTISYNFCLSIFYNFANIYKSVSK